MFPVRRQLWLILGIETVFFVALAAWVLVRLDRLFEPASLVIALMIIVIGDIATVLLMQRFAPTSITFAAGEADGLFGEVVAGFGLDTHGRVLICGEQWAARLNGTQRVSPGDRVRVLSRRGLTLLVERSD
jgi:membrane protein implicated in regulation of membrane protease activity